MSLDTVPGHVSFILNGAEVTVETADSARLSQVLREAAGARDVKVGCNAGDCGACTVLLDGAPVCSCLVAAGQAQGRTVETQAGLVARDPHAARLARSFQAHQAAQCGICTPGMMVSAVALLREGRPLTEARVADALGGVLCRCTGYRKIIAAVLDTAEAQTDTGSGIGARLPRLDGWAKVSGSERFGDDVAQADALVCRVIRSPHHSAAFRFGDLEAFRRAAGLDLVLTAADVPGRNLYGVIPGYHDQPVFAEGEIRFRGEAIAAVVGPADAVADLPAFPVELEERPAALDVASAMQSRALHPTKDSNLMCRGYVARGDAVAAMEGAVHRVGGRFSTGFVEHAYIEPEAAVARRVGDRIEVHCCTQSPYMNRDALAGVLGLDPGDVRIIPTAVGGGFGSKLDLSAQPYVAIAAWVLGRPVRMAYGRIESMASSTKRHPSAIDMEIGADAEGNIVAARFEGTFNTGAYASWGPTVATRVPIHASGPYRTPNYEARSAGIYTNCVPAGAFRGFGVPQSAVAQEQLYDLLADRLGMDRLAFRRRNCLRNGDPTVTGQVFATGMGIAECFDALKPHWERALAEAERFNACAGQVRRGVGIAGGWYGCGNTSMSNPSTIRAGITAGGEIRLHQGAVDIGQGSNTVIPQIFAEAFGIDPGKITLVGADTDLTPDAGKTSASRQTFITGNAARLCGLALRERILRLGNVSGAARITIGEGYVDLADGGATRRIPLEAGPGDYALEATETYDPPTLALDQNGQGEPYAVFGTAAQLAELEVDMALGTVKLLRFVAAHDVGRAINPLLVEGQVEGGIAQGIGMALMEEFVPGRTENLHDYLIPTIGDVPPIETIIIESGDPHGPYGAKGLGEHCLIPTAPAILNAIAHATGARIHDLPATPDKVRTAIRAAGRGRAMKDAGTLSGSFAGIDVGGTFTDLVHYDSATGSVRLAKVPTTPGNQALGVLSALDAAGVDAATLDLIVHGTTTTTNAVLERRLCRTGMVTTRGFRDVLELGRRTRPQAYGMHGQFRPIIPRDLRLEVPERMLADGSVHTPLDEEALRAALRRLAGDGCEALVIHFLHAYANPAHELRAGEIAAQEWPNGNVTLGHSLLSESREYERGVTAAVNASVQPLLRRYVENLADRLAERGYARDLLVMNGNGGMVSARVVAREAAKTVMSGPASGVMAAAYTGRRAGIPDLLTYDMGGTSTDVAMIRGADPAVSHEIEIEYAMPIHVPMVDVRTVGAGGGSVARVDASGLLQVGPDSAGSEPGPICYGKGGTEPTISDANMLLGRMDPAKLDPMSTGVSMDRIREIFAQKLGAPLGLDPIAAAAAVLRVATAKMADAVRMVSISLGEDPRDFALFAFGGAGPLHACAIARELGVPRVLVPARPGITNALGCIVADLRHDFVTTVNAPLDLCDMEAVHRHFARQTADGQAAIAQERVEIARTRVLHSVDMQFIGQTHLLRVPLPGPDPTREDLHALFEEAYFRRFQVELPEIRPALVNVNTSVIGRRPDLDLASLIDARGRRQTLAEARTGTRAVWFDGWHDTPVYWRDHLPGTASIDGPAIVEQMDCTLVLDPGDRAVQDGDGNLIVTVGAMP